MEPKFKYLEIVNIFTKDDDITEINGLQGTILAFDYDESQQSWVYIIDIPDIEVTYAINEADLASTGKMDKEENFYNPD